MPDSPNIVAGMYGDPVIFYGTSAARVTSNHKESEHGLLSDAPVDGPIKAHEAMAPEGLKNITLRKIVNSPSAITVAALPLMYIAFHYAFGA